MLTQLQRLCLALEAGGDLQSIMTGCGLPGEQVLNIIRSCLKNYELDSKGDPTRKAKS